MHGRCHRTTLLFVTLFQNRYCSVVVVVVVEYLYSASRSASNALMLMFPDFLTGLFTCFPCLPEVASLARERGRVKVDS